MKREFSCSIRLLTTLVLEIFDGCFHRRTQNHDDTKTHKNTEIRHVCFLSVYVYVSAIVGQNATKDKQLQYPSNIQHVASLNKTFSKYSGTVVCIFFYSFQGIRCDC